MHALNDKDLIRYRDGLLRLLRPGGLYVLFAHLRDEAADVPGRGVYEESIHELFSRQFTLENVRHGMTQVEDKTTLGFSLVLVSAQLGPVNSGQ
ncbi:MAG: hypothetical protein M5U34_02590 [Chloroflexi bacterium]|nr:hypothetical protein [Chloroflexota bacterium]